ncbi:TraK domain-containing protein [Aliarcobacter skirrowii]|uniref:TraK domain-containing protein n=1 Tax=Aliarcobacter skirrowii TaxID=28200 RepID=UPI0029A27FD1|nr:type-F conjugative transfer system secretin TraK [Aliarcobacter skirrowii]MDX4028404.1 type-F conjugative transfer system secretin TraK [Aliarcobacter skirrowii]
MIKKGKYLVGIIASIAIFSTLNANDEPNLKKIDYSMSFKFVDISKTDVNRVICEDGSVGKVVFSKDKEISIETDKENAFIKLLPVVVRKNGIVVNSEVNDFQRDVFIECNKSIYSLNLIPRDISAQTILLVNTTGNNKNNIEATKFEKANPFEKTVTTIIQDIYKSNTPQGYKKINLKAKTLKFQELEFKPTIKYVGSDYIAYEYSIKANDNIEINEKMFLDFIASNPLALALTDLTIEKNKTARLLVIANATPDPITYDEKIKNYEKSLKELNKKSNKAKKEANQIEPMKDEDMK